MIYATIVAGTNGLNKAVGTAFGLLGVQGISMIVSAGTATVRGASTGFDIEALGNTFEENKSRCICDHCQEIYDIVGTKGVEHHQRRLTGKRSENLLPIAHASV